MGIEFYLLFKMSICEGLMISGTGQWELKCANDLVKSTEFLMCIRTFIYVYFKEHCLRENVKVTTTYLYLYTYYKLMW